MDRGLTAPLSGNEQVTLLRVSYGIAASTELRSLDLQRLFALGLLTATDNKIVLTQSGAARVAKIQGMNPGPTMADPPPNLIDKLQ
ncbi:MAG: hypothetical protein PSV46_21710 [Reyranella sp.]|nr:hypothetical protein [Reyranella sp.]